MTNNVLDLIQLKYFYINQVEFLIILQVLLIMVYLFGCCVKNRQLLTIIINIKILLTGLNSYYSK
jgi:hypothetical protein